MKALVLHGPGGNYIYETDWPVPARPEGWAIVKTAYSGICGSDLPRYGSTGSYKHPMVLGHEFSGTVYETGENSRFKTGDKVAVLPIIPCGYCAACKRDEPFHCASYQFIGSRNDGGHAQYCAVPETNLFLLPENVDLAAGSLIEPILVALGTVRSSGFTPGKTAVVFGAGPIGLLIACWLRVFGATKVIISDLRDFSLDLAKKCGFTDFFNPLTDPAGSVQNIDFAFEAAGSAKALSSAIDMLAGKGVLTVVGRDVNDTVIPLKTFEQMMRKEITLKTTWGYRTAGEMDFLYEVLKKELIPAAMLITHNVKPEESAQLIDDILNRRMDYGKAVIDFT